MYRKEPSQTTIAWTEERRARALQLWTEGRSASAIARMLGGVSRSAIIGIVHRADRACGAKFSSQRRRTAVAPRPRPPKPIVIKTKRPAVMDLPAAPLPVSAADDIARVRSVLDLEPHHCRWPIGDPKLPGFGFCGAAKTEGLPYCAGHAARAYTPLPARQTNGARRAA